MTRAQRRRVARRRSRRARTRRPTSPASACSATCTTLGARERRRRRRSTRPRSRRSTACRSCSRGDDAVSGGSRRNREYADDFTTFAAGVPEARAPARDATTSGGLLVALARPRPRRAAGPDRRPPRRRRAGRDHGARSRAAPGAPAWSGPGPVPQTVFKAVGGACSAGKVRLLRRSVQPRPDAGLSGAGAAHARHRGARRPRQDGAGRRPHRRRHRPPAEEQRARYVDRARLRPARAALGTPLSVIDVPGHERFVRTMVAGATGIDAFLMVVAADDGVMPQTVEHAAVLRGARRRRRASSRSPRPTRPTRPGGRGGRELLPGPSSSPAPRARARGSTSCGPRSTASRRGCPAARRRRRPARLHVDRLFTVEGAGRS